LEKTMRQAETFRRAVLESCNRADSFANTIYGAALNQAKTTQIEGSAVLHNQGGARRALADEITLGIAGSGTLTPPATEGAERADEEEELSDRQCLILETMLKHEIASERRRQSRAAVVKLVNRKHKPGTYNRDFARLVKLEYLRSREGREGGVWINPSRKADVQRIVSSA